MGGGVVPVAAILSMQMVILARTTTKGIDVLIATPSSQVMNKAGDPMEEMTHLAVLQSSVREVLTRTGVCGAVQRIAL